MADMDIYEGAFSGPQIDNILGNSTRQDSIAIVSNNNTHIAIAAGQYVYVKNHGTLSEGMYKANSNISANGTLTSSNLTAVSNGVANELKSATDKIGILDTWATGYLGINLTDSYVDVCPRFVLGLVDIMYGGWHYVFPVKGDGYCRTFLPDGGAITSQAVNNMIQMNITSGTATVQYAYVLVR